MAARTPIFCNALITTGIFIIAAMSLNLLLGYTGQLSLGHVAFFGIGAYASALTALGFDVELSSAYASCTSRGRSWSASSLAIAGRRACAATSIGKLSFRVRGAYFVIVTISFAEVTRLVALNWVELTQGPLALDIIPPLTLGVARPRLFRRSGARIRTTTWCSPSASLVLCRHQPARALAHRPRDGRAARRTSRWRFRVGIDVTRYLVLAAVVSAGIAGAAGSLYAHYLRIIDPDIFLFIYTVTMVIMVITGGKGTLAGPLVGGLIFGFMPVVRAVVRLSGAAVDPLRAAHDPDRVLPAAGHRAGGREMVRRALRQNARGPSAVAPKMQDAP